MLIGLMAAFLPQTVSGEESGVMPSFLHTLSIEDGLPSNAVLAIHKDRHGFMWFGTEKGLARFDGNQVKGYPSTESEEVWAIEEMDSRNLLIGTVSRLMTFDRYGGILKEVEFPQSHVRVVKKVSPTCYAIGTDVGLYLYENGKVERIPIESGLSSSNDITGIAMQDSLNIWCSTADGLVYLDLKSRYPLLHRMPDKMGKGNHFTCLAVKGDTLFVGGFNKGLFRYNVRSREFSEIEGFEHNLIQCIGVSGDRLYVGTNGRGLRIVSTSGKDLGTLTARQRHNSGLMSNTVASFLYDDGLLWTGTQFGGVSYSPRSKDKFMIYSSGDFNSAEHRVASFYLYPDGAKLIGTREGLYFIDEKGGTRKHYSIWGGTPGVRSDIITYIGKIGEEVLVGTYGGGISRFNRQTQCLEDVADNNLFRYGCVFQFIPDHDENMWVATQEGLFHATVKGDVLAHYTRQNSSLPTSIVRRVCLDSHRRLWVGTKFGLVLIDTKTGSATLDNIDIPARDHVHYLYHDKRGNTFVCGMSGLSVVDSSLKVVRRFGLDSWLNGNKPRSVKEVGNDTYWIATDREIVKYSIKDSVLQKFERQDGLPSLPFNFNSLMASDSVIYFTNEGGLVYASTSNVENPLMGEIAPMVMECIADGVSTDIMDINWKDGFELPSGTAVATFRVSSMDYTLPYSNSYEYRLEGYDSDWRRLGGRSRISYRNLPSGDYVFHVRNGDTGKSTSIPVKVRISYLWMSVTAGICLIVLALMAYFSYRIWKLKLRMRKERQILTSVSEVKENSRKPSQEDSGHELLMDKLLLYMDENKPYTNSRLTIKEVAKDLETTDTELSRLLNTRIDVNWNKFVNTYRVNEVKRCIKDGQLSRITLKALSEKCGFGSKTTFYRAFKGIAGMTPLEYCQQKGFQVTDSEWNRE